MDDDQKKTLTPKLRFPEFRTLQPWVIRNGGDLFDNRLEDGSDQLPIYSVTMTEGLVRRSSLERKIDDIGVTGGNKKVHKGDIAYNMMRVWQGASGVAPEDCMVSPAYVVLAPREDVRPEFYGYFFKLDSSLRLFTSHARGANKDRLRLYYDSFAKTPLPQPSPAEQRKIAACLGSLDELIAAERRKLEAVRSHKKGLMQLLFPREGESHPRLRFPEFYNAPEWKTGKASDYMDVLQGFGFPDRLQGSTDGEFPFYKVSDISAAVNVGKVYLADANNHIDRAVLAELRAKPLPIGTTVFAKIGEAIRSNKRAVTTRPCLVDNNAAGVKAKPGVAVDEFVYHLWSMVPLIEYAGGVVPAVNKSAIEQIPVCFPQPDEQRRIAACLSSLDALITAASRKLDGLQAHKKGLMQQLFPSHESE